MASYLTINYFKNANSLVDGVAVVYYLDKPVLEIKLADGSHEIINSEHATSLGNDKYSVTGKNGPVKIEYKNHQVRVYDEISPQHICRTQGWSSSQYSPITCLPNAVVIRIEVDKIDLDLPDDITG